LWVGTRKTREGKKKIEVQTKDHTQKVENAQWGSPKRRIHKT